MVLAGNMTPVKAYLPAGEFHFIPGTLVDSNQKYPVNEHFCGGALIAGSQGIEVKVRLFIAFKVR